MTVEGFHSRQHQKEAQTNASGLLWWQPDHVCVYLQTDPCCWRVCGTDHPLRRYVLCSIYISVPFVQDCPGPAPCPTKPNRKKERNIVILFKNSFACYIYVYIVIEIWIILIMHNKGIMLFNWNTIQLTDFIWNQWKRPHWNILPLIFNKVGQSRGLPNPLNLFICYFNKRKLCAAQQAARI